MADDATPTTRRLVAVYELDLLPPADRRLAPGETGAWQQHVRAADDAHAREKVLRQNPGARVVESRVRRTLEEHEQVDEVQPDAGGAQ